MRVVEVPKPGIAENDLLKGHLARHSLGDLGCQGVPEVRHAETRALVDNADADADGGRALARVADDGLHGKRGGRLAQVGNGIDPDGFEIDRSRHDEADRPGEAAVGCPIVGVLPRQHGRREGVVDADGDRVMPAKSEKACDVKLERGVALAKVISDPLPVDEDLGRMEDGFELDPDDLASPLFRRVELAPVPGRTQVAGRPGGDLPGGGDLDLVPIRYRRLGGGPGFGPAPVVGVGPEEPPSIERDFERPLLADGPLPAAVR